MNVPLHAGTRMSLHELRSAAVELQQLIDDGWQAEDRLEGPTLIRRNAPTPADALSAFTHSRVAVREAEIIGQRAGRQIRLRRINDSLEVTDLPDALPSDLFDERGDLELAENAWQRGADAALALPFAWTVLVTLDLRRLVPTPSGLEVRVCLRTVTIETAIAHLTLAQAGNLLPNPKNRRVFIACLDHCDPVHFGGVTLTGMPVAGLGDQLLLPAIEAHLPGETGGMVAGLPTPAQLQPLPGRPTSWQEPAKALTRLGAICVWSSLANTATQTPQGVELEFIGFKRTTLTFTSLVGVTPDAPRAAFRLRNWVFQEPSPDRLLAVRQVVSLYSREEALDHADDIQRSAEVVYAGLRTDAVVEAVKSSREAHNHALEAVRQSLNDAHDMTKSAIERFIASAIAVGGVLIANAAQSLNNHVSRELMIAVALFLILLAGFTIGIEGRLLGIPLENLSDDLARSSPLLTTDQVDRITAIPSVTQTKKRVRTIRFVLPGIYVVAAAAILLFGYPSHYR